MPADFWIPLAIYPSVGGSGLAGVDRQPKQLRVVGRLRPGMTRPAAAAALNAWTQRATANLSGDERATAVVLNPQATAGPLPDRGVSGFSPAFLAIGPVLAVARPHC